MQFPTRYSYCKRVRSWVVLVVISGCTFDTSNSFEGTVPIDAAALPVDADLRSDAPNRVVDAQPILPDAEVDAATPLCDPTDPNLVLCMEFEDLSPENISDSSGYGNDGETSGATLGAGYRGQGLEVGRGLNYSSRIDANADLQQARTIEMWLKPSITAIDFQGLFDSTEYWLYIFNGNRLACVFDGVDQSSRSGVVLSNNVWHHVACTFDGTMVRIYVDGVEAPKEESAPLFFGGGPAIFAFGEGLDAWGADYDAQGVIDEIRVWKTVRTPDQLTGK